MVRIISKEQYKVNKWKNGAGETFEISRYPDNESYLWRLSMAPVTADGPFSLFSGYDRYLTLLEGNSLDLNNQMLKKGQIIKFSGDDETFAKLPSGKIVDLNLIVKRDMVKVKYSIFSLIKGPHFFSLKGKICIIFLISGQLVYLKEKLHKYETLLAHSDLNISVVSKEAKIVFIDLAY